MRMFFTLDTGAKLPWPFSIGAFLQSPLSMKNRESNAEGAETINHFARPETSLVNLPGGRFSTLEIILPLFPAS